MARTKVTHEGEDYITVFHKGEEFEITGAAQRIIKDLVEVNAPKQYKSLTEELFRKICSVMMDMKYVEYDDVRIVQIAMGAVVSYCDQHDVRMEYLIHGKKK